MVEEIFLDSLLGAQDDAEAEDEAVPPRLTQPCWQKGLCFNAALWNPHSHHVLPSCASGHFVCAVPKRASDPWNWNDKQLWAIMLVLRLAEAPGRAASAANPEPSPQPAYLF